MRSDLTADIKMMIRECYIQLYANKLDNLDEMSKFFEKHKASELKK